MQLSFKGKNLQFIFRLKFIIGILVVALITLSIVSYYSMKEYGKFSNLIQQNTNVLYNVESLTTNAIELQANYQGYVITKQAQNMVEISSTIQKLNSIYPVLEDEVEGSAFLTNHLKIIKNLTDLQQKILSVETILPSDDILLTSRERNIILEGREILNEIKYQAEKMKNFQLRNIAEMQERKSGKLNQNYLLIAIFILFTLIILFLAYIIIKKELRKSHLLSLELEQSIHQLSQSNQELEQFAYVASHDLQEPLRKIIAFTDIISEKYKNIVPEEGHTYFERITSSTNRMKSLITDLLNFSRATRNNIDKERIDLNNLIHEVVSDLSEVINEKNAQIKYKLHRKIFVEATPIQMRQLFQNLISNALKFSKNGVAPEIKISSTNIDAEKVEEQLSVITSDKYVQIEVIDNGIGFNEEYLSKIFTIFQRLHGRSKYSGTGIGLALCKRIVENHNGFLTAKSKLGKGSSFYVYLPLYQENIIEI